MSTKHLCLSLALAAMVLPGCSKNAAYRKSFSVMELAFHLRSADGEPLAGFPISVSNFYSNDLTTNSSTDENGDYSYRATHNRSSIPLFEPFLAPDNVIRHGTVDIYLPSVSKYGEYQLMFIAPEPAEGLAFDRTMERPRTVPTKIAVGQDVSWDAPREFAHGAYYHGSTGGLMTTTIIANGEERLVPLRPRGASAFLEKVTVSEDPKLQISATASPLETPRGWRLEVLLVLEPYVPEPPLPSVVDAPPDPFQGGAEIRTVLQRGSEVRVGDLTLTLESAGFEHWTDLSTESNARIRVRRGTEEETVELSRHHPSDPTYTAVLGREIYLEVADAYSATAQAVVWVK